MGKATTETLKKLSAYKKKEIIEALGNSYQFGYLAEDMLRYLEEKKSNDVISQHGEALNQEIAARKAFMEWKTEICSKYGDGQTVKLRDIPPLEIHRGATLEKALKETTEKERRLDKQVNRILKVGSDEK